MGRTVTVMISNIDTSLLTGIFSWSGAMGSGPVKGFNSPEVQQIITKKHDSAMNKIAKEDGEMATFAAGCFWGVQLAFQRVPGVASTMVGYTAGEKQHPTYQEVCTGSTGHTEALTMLFNPQLVTYRELLAVLFDRMDPPPSTGRGTTVAPSTGV